MKFSRKESISSVDERWLDHEANTVDEERIVHELDAASDYKRVYEELDGDGKAVVKKLKEWAADFVGVAVPSNKHKSIKFARLDCPKFYRRI